MKIINYAINESTQRKIENLLGMEADIIVLSVESCNCKKRIRIPEELEIKWCGTCAIDKSWPYWRGVGVICKKGLGYVPDWFNPDKNYAIPYIIIEHWSGYLPENGAFLRMSPFKQRFVRRIAQEAEQILTVSMPLQRAMQSCGIVAQRWGTIDHVVDEFFSQHSTLNTQHSTLNTQLSTTKTLLHVSCFDEKAKNVKGLLCAAKMLSEKRQDWRLVLVGNGLDYNEVRAFADHLEIPQGLIEWTGELTPREVADAMHRADALVLSSRYETYGIVLAEAATAGLPILSTPVGIAEDLHALIVPQEIAQHKPGTFAEFMETILWNKQIINHKSEIINQFTADTIGRKLLSIYDSCLHRDI